MTDRRLVTILTFAVIGLLCIISGALIFFDRGGAAAFDIFGQEFSSTNVGLAVLFVAILVLAYLLRETKTEEKTADMRSVMNAPSVSGEVSWMEFIAGVDELVLRLTSANGFRPDLIVGICGGGLMTADLIAKRLGHIPCLALWPNRHSTKAGSVFAGLADRVNRTDFHEVFTLNGVNRVLLVDDVVYSGSTLSDALQFLADKSPLIGSGEVEVRCATLFSLASADFKADYIIDTDPRTRKMMPSSDRLRKR